MCPRGQEHEEQLGLRLERLQFGAAASGVAGAQDSRCKCQGAGESVRVGAGSSSPSYKYDLGVGEAGSDFAGLGMLGLWGVRWGGWDWGRGLWWDSSALRLI